MFYDRYKELCRLNGTTPTRAANEIGLSNSITTKWKKTGAMPDGGTLVRVADYFGITVDELLGKEKQPTTGSGYELSEDEADIIRMYRALDERGKASVRNAIQYEYKNIAGEDNRLSRREA